MQNQLFGLIGTLIVVPSYMVKGMFQMKKLAVVTIVLLSSICAFAQDKETKAKFTCDIVKTPINAVIELIQIEGDGKRFMDHLANPNHETSFVLKYYEGKSGETDRATILKNTPTEYTGMGLRLWHARLNFEGSRTVGGTTQDANFDIAIFRDGESYFYFPGGITKIVDFKCDPVEFVDTAVLEGSIQENGDESTGSDE